MTDDMIQMRCADNADADDLRQAAQAKGIAKTGLADRLENLAFAMDHARRTRAARSSGETATADDAVGGLISALEDDIAQGDMPNIRRTLTALKSAHQRSRTGAAR